MNQPQTLVVNGITVDMRSGNVTGATSATRLQLKTLGVLSSLAEYAPDMVTKKEIFEKVWPQTAVSENVLAQAISDLRRVFGESPKNPVIETVPKIGYRLIAAIGPRVGSDGDPSPAQSGVASPTREREPKPRLRFWQWVLLVVLGTYLVHFLIVTLQGRGHH
jgi:transcriptional activator of cad operon